MTNASELSNLIICCSETLFLSYKNFVSPLSINKLVSQSKVTPSNVYSEFVYHAFCSCDLDPMTLIYELDLDIVKIYLHIKNEVSRSRYLKVRARTGQTDRQTQPNALLAAFRCGNNNSFSQRHTVHSVHTMRCRML